MSEYENLCRRVALAIVEQIKVKSDSCLGLPTGHTPVGVYKYLAQWSREGKIDWSAVRCFALDDYVGAEEQQTFHYFLEKNLYCHTNLQEGNKYNPCMTDNYDQLIESCGGLDLTILGIGGNGHIAFNEPGTCAMSWTHCTWLNQSTRLANQDSFGALAAVPTQGLTMGLATILKSRRVILMASGDKKKAIVEQAFEGPVTVDVPASLLKQHPHTDVWTDFSRDFSFPASQPATHDTKSRSGGFKLSLIAILLATIAGSAPVHAEKTNPDFVPPEITLPYAQAPMQSQAAQSAPGQQAAQGGGAQPGFAGFQIPGNLGQAPGLGGSQVNPFLMKGADRLRQPPGTQFASKGSPAPSQSPAGVITGPGSYPGGYPGAQGAAAPAYPGQPAQGAPQASLNTQAQLANPTAVIATSKGNITIMLFREYAPRTVAAFMEMVRSGFYNGLTFHRVEPGFVIQGGDPKGDGSGFYIPQGSNQPRMLPLETSPKVSHNAAGVVAMAHLPGNPNSGSCQFYITLRATPNLDGQYTIFGGVTQGMDVVNRITKYDRIDSITVSQ